MPSNRRPRLRDLQGELFDVIGEDDGVDPRLDYRPERPAAGRLARKLRQLCKQTERALVQALADCRHPALLALDVVQVRPAPDSSRLRVTLRAQGSLPRQALEVALTSAEGHLRCEVAAAISRRKAPVLVYDIT